MGKLGFSRTTIHDLVHEETVAHDHVPGRAYEIADPSQKLIHLIGGGFFNEPRYYDPNRSYAAFMVELLTTGKIASKIVDEQGLTAHAREVIEAATARPRPGPPERKATRVGCAGGKPPGWDTAIRPCPPATPPDEGRREVSHPRPPDRWLPVLITA